MQDSPDERLALTGSLDDVESGFGDDPSPPLGAVGWILLLPVLVALLIWLI
jgi:hypothetical protein